MANKTVWEYSYAIKQERRRNFWFLIVYALTLFLVISLVVNFVCFSVAVESSSMQPLLSHENRVFVTPLASPKPAKEKSVPFLSNLAHCIELQRGDVVLVAPLAQKELAPMQKFVSLVVKFATFQQCDPYRRAKLATENYCVRRVIGLPGDTIYMKDFVLYVRPQNEAHALTEFEIAARAYDIYIDEPPAEWSDAAEFSGGMEQLKLGEGEYFVLADNRAHAFDSRIWGAIPGDKIEGKLVLRFWPLNKISAL